MKTLFASTSLFAVLVALSACSSSPVSVGDDDGGPKMGSGTGTGPGRGTGTGSGSGTNEGSGTGTGMGSGTGTSGDAGPHGGHDSGPEGGPDGAPDTGPGSGPGSSGTGTGGCNYQMNQGTVTITSITPSSGANSCMNDGQRVAFTFTPAVGSNADDAGALDQGFLTLDVSGTDFDPPNSCLAPLGITVGAQFSATQRLELSGTCDPVIYEVNVDLSTCITACPAGV